MADTGIDEAELRSALEQWTVGLADEPGRTTAVRGRILRRRRRRAIGSVGLAAAVLVAAVVVVGSVSGTAGPQPVPPVKRPTTPAPVIAFPTVFAGGTVVGQAAGVGAGEQTIAVTWPAAGQAKVYYHCLGSVDTGITISVAGYESVGTFCGAGELSILDVSSSKFVSIPAGARVLLTVDTAGPGMGAWSLAVIDTDVHWGDHWRDAGVLPAEKTFEGRKLTTWLHGGASGSSASLRLDKTDDDAVIFIECSQAGELTLLLNTNEVATVTCPSAPWSLQRVALSPAELAGIGWVAGQKVTLALRARQVTNAPMYGGILVYGK